MVKFLVKIKPEIRRGSQHAKCQDEEIEEPMLWKNSDLMKVMWILCKDVIFQFLKIILWETRFLPVLWHQTSFYENIQNIIANNWICPSIFFSVCNRVSHNVQTGKLMLATSFSCSAYPRMWENQKYLTRKTCGQH